MVPPPRSHSFARLMSGLHRTVDRLSGGRVLNHFRGAPVLWLTSTGRRSGKSRLTPLLYLDDGGAFVVAASASGLDRHPDWYLNLQANPAARVRIGKLEQAIRAEVAPAADRQRLWPQLVGIIATTKPTRSGRPARFRSSSSGPQGSRAGTPKSFLLLV